jgi:hypothetical protein
MTLSSWFNNKPDMARSRIYEENVVFVSLVFDNIQEMVLNISWNHIYFSYFFSLMLG